eukprot:m.52523 g.52523  ORF g.52523 m.52523 type:complete len:96 (+) comp11309_c0_seq1:193-480(+)
MCTQSCFMHIVSRIYSPILSFAWLLNPVLVLIVKFNRRPGVPDVVLDLNSEGLTSDDFDEQLSEQELLERQGDMIRFLKRYIALVRHQYQAATAH